MFLFSLLIINKHFCLSNKNMKKKNRISPLLTSGNKHLSEKQKCIFFCLSSAGLWGAGAHPSHLRARGRANICLSLNLRQEVVIKVELLATLEHG